MNTTQRTDINRRTFLNRGAIGAGHLALLHLLGRDGLLRASGASPDPARSGILGSPHGTARVKRIIHLCMAGGPSHLETLDYKPELARLDGQPMPESFTRGQQLAQLQGARNSLRCLGPQHPFRAWGASGQMISEALPHIGSIADELAVVRSLYTEQINHDPAHTFMNTGSIIPGRPSMGSWLLYGLGSECDNLPGYVVLISEGGGQAQPISSRQWHSGFLPSRFQGVQFHSSGDPVHYVQRPDGVSGQGQSHLVNTVNRLNGLLAQDRNDPEISTRISQYEMAFRMQTSVPALMDVSDEPESTFEHYGCRPGDGSFASNCLLARRLAERGVRFIQLYHRGWDHHGGIQHGVSVTAKLVDQGTAALVRDLRQRGLLDDTLILWAGEFGRTPMAQGSGRDHHILGFSCWLAGGGIRGGASYGETDELGYRAVRNPVSVHDLHATMLHLMGIDHERLTFRSQGRDFRLTDVSGRVVREILT